MARPLAGRSLATAIRLLTGEPHVLCMGLHSHVRQLGIQATGSTKRIGHVRYACAADSFPALLVSSHQMVTTTCQGPVWAEFEGQMHMPRLVQLCIDRNGSSPLGPSTRILYELLSRVPEEVVTSPVACFVSCFRSLSPWVSSVCRRPPESPSRSFKGLRRWHKVVLSRHDWHGAELACRSARNLPATGPKLSSCTTDEDLRRL